jgi:hypothetical protein
VRDFIGDTCKTVASRVRGAVASTTFDNFHKHSADIIKQAVFGLNASGESNDQLLFSANKLSVTNVDIQSVTPVEQRTRDALQKSVQLAIEISTDSQEALANHEAMREEQAAQGMLERQKIEDQSASEAARSSLLELQAKTAAVESTGQAKAEAIATAEAQLIQVSLGFLVFFHVCNCVCLISFLFRNISLTSRLLDGKTLPGRSCGEASGVEGAGATYSHGRAAGDKEGDDDTGG